MKPGEQRPHFVRRVFNDEMLTVCEATMHKVCEDFEAELIEFNGESDHVRLLVNYPPKVAVSGLVNSLKGVSARFLRRDFTGRTNRAIMHATSGRRPTLPPTAAAHHSRW